MSTTPATETLSRQQKQLVGLTGGMALVVLALVFGLRGGFNNNDHVRWDMEVNANPLPVAAVEKAFSKLDYDVTQIRSGQGVPRVLVRSIPDDLGQVAEVDRRKTLFLGAVLPLALAVNEQIMRERAHVATCAKKISGRERLSRAESKELERLARVYRVIEEEPDNAASALSEGAMVDELLLRAAPLPVSLVLAQAAEESAWGLSRFAAEGNALYGQWVWNDEAGMIPKGRPEGQSHRVQAFRDIYESTLSYAHNLNTHRAYEKFRHMRADMMAANEHLDGRVLAGTLTRYSGRGQAYVESLRSIMRANNLGALDHARFVDQTTPPTDQSRSATAL
jgi:Bax protein